MSIGELAQVDRLFPVDDFTPLDAIVPLDRVGPLARLGEPDLSGGTERLDHLMSLLELLATEGQLIDVVRLPARTAREGRLEREFPDRVQSGLHRLGIGRLWSHQAAAIDLARARRSVAVATGTASGKSLCYQAPIAEAVSDPIRPGTALLVFPTKALAHDQLGVFGRLAYGPGLEGLVPAAYDGDSTAEERAWVRRHANVVLTNPEMLHCALLPHHGRWATFLMRLRYVVVDELHMFRGVFGTHVAHVLRRLRRLCAHYGSDPTFIFCSATIGRPGELASGLCGLPVTEVVDDGSPRGERLVALWNPPLAPRFDDDGEAITGQPWPGAGPVRRSPHGETAGLVAELVGDGRRTIAFCRSRRATEVVAADVRRRLPARPRRPGPALPRRLPGRGATRDRGRAVRRPARRGRGHQRPRARRRHRRARRLRARRLPRHDRLVLAAGGPGRPRAAGSRWPCSWPARTSSTSG